MEFEESLNQVAAKVRDLKDGIEKPQRTLLSCRSSARYSVMTYSIQPKSCQNSPPTLESKKAKRSTTRSCTTVKCRFLSNARRSAYRSAWRTQASCTGISR